MLSDPARGPARAPVALRVPICLALGLPLAAAALQFPDTADLKADFKVLGRQPDGKPLRLGRGGHGLLGDSLYLTLAWEGDSLSGARYERKGAFPQDQFSDLASEYGAGATWHEVPGQPPPAIAQAQPGIQQQWILKGYGHDLGWLGSGMKGRRFFLQFLKRSPLSPPVVAGPLRLDPRLPAFLDSSSEWTHAPCPDKGDKSSTCYTPPTDGRVDLRLDRRRPQEVEIWWRDPDDIKDIRARILDSPGEAHAEYARELSDLLNMEARTFLVKLAQRLPALFTWPSWQLQDFKEGKVPAETYLAILRQRDPGRDRLPILDWESRDISLRINLFYNGTFHVQVKEKP